MKQEKPQRVGRLLQQYEFLSSTPPMPMSSFAYPPIFLSPSSFDPFSTPSPSPLPAAGAHHSSVPKAAIIGGSIAGVVTLAVTASVLISAATGKVGLACLLGPVCRLFSCLFGKFTAPCSAKLKSLFSTLNKWNPARKTASNKAANSNGDAGADDCGVDLYEILGGSPNTINKAESGAAAAAHSLAKSPVQDVLKGDGDQLGTSAQYAFLMTSVSDFAKSEMKQQKEKMLKPMNPHIAKAEGFAQSLLSVTDNVSDDLRALQQSADAHLNEVSKLTANADHMKASTEGIAAAWKNSGDAAVLMFDEAIRVGAEKTKATITNEHAAGMKRLHERLQEPVIVVEEEVVLHRMLGKPIQTRGKESHELVEEEEEEAAAKQQVVLGGSGPVCIVESASDASTLELQLQEKDIEIGGAAAVHHNPAGSISNMALVPTTDTGDNVRNSPATTGGSFVAVPTKAIVPGRTMTSAAWPQAREDDVKGKHMMIAKGKRPSNLGHVSFSCEISAHRLRFFTSCRSGGTYGSPPPSPAPAPVPNHPNYHHTSNNYHTITNGSNNLSHTNQPANTANYYVPWYNEVQIADTRASTATHYNNLIHQPAQSILMQSNTAALPPTLHTARLSPMLDTKPHSENYGCPFDGVL